MKGGGAVDNLFSMKTVHAIAWLRHYATSRKVADSNLDEVINFF
jgi:hypothetical protein